MKKLNTKTIAIMALYCAIFVILDRKAEFRADCFADVLLSSGLEEWTSGRDPFGLSAAGHRFGRFLWDLEFSSGLSDRLCRLWHCGDVSESWLLLQRRTGYKPDPSGFFDLVRNLVMGNAVMEFAGLQRFLYSSYNSLCDHCRSAALRTSEAGMEETEYRLS